MGLLKLGAFAVKSAKTKPMLVDADTTAAAGKTVAGAGGTASDSVEAQQVKVGLRARICSDAHKHSCGMQGVVRQILKGIATMEAEPHFQVVQANVQHLELCGALRPAQKISVKMLSAEMKRDILFECRWDEDRQNHDKFEPTMKLIEGAKPVLLNVDHIETWWAYVSRVVKDTVQKRVVMLNPLMLQSWKGALVDNAAHAEAIGAAIKARCSSVDIAVMPLWCPDHWTLLVIDVEVQTCRYYDSLFPRKEENHCFADQLVSMLQTRLSWLPLQAPAQRNFCRQEETECGFYVAWWMEEELRRACGEGWCARGYPTILGNAGVRTAMCSLFKSLEPVHQKILADMTALQKKEKAGEDLYNEAAAKKAKETGEELQTLEAAATAAVLKADFPVGFVFDIEAEGGLEHWAEQMLEHKLLFEEHMKDCLRVKARGAGICSSCHYSSGCYRCYWPKTVRYWRNKECRNELMEGYTAKAKAAAKGKAKAQHFISCRAPGPGPRAPGSKAAGLPVPEAGGPAAKAKGKAAKAKGKAAK